MGLEKSINEEINTDCVYFTGHMPCTYHKQEGVHCSDCSHYKKIDKNILIIKLGAAGEVLRNTPLLRRIKQEYPKARIFWLTQYPELIPRNDVFRVYNFDHRELELIKDVEFDILYSLDKHEETGALANRIRAKTKKGFSQRSGSVVPFDKDAEHKWITGIFDDLAKLNTKHYVEEIFEICGFEFNGEKYMLPDYRVPDVEIDRSKKVVAINGGAGGAWKPRIYSKERRIELAKMLIEEGYEVMIVGGTPEDENNRLVADKSGAKYFGVFSYADFIGLLSLSDIVVTTVTFALHVAIGLEKKIVSLNNVFNRNEFHMYGNGVILEPDLPCLMCYKPDFDEKCPVRNCMDLVTPEEICRKVEEFKN